MTRRKISTNTNRAVAYARVSTEKQSKYGVSLDSQENKMRDAAAVRGLEVVEVIIDDVSGKNLDRPGMERMLAMVRAREVSYVIVPKLDRLGRSVRDVLDLVDQFDEYGVELLSLHETLDTKTAMGRFVLRMFASLAEMEREIIVERTIEAMSHMRKVGRSTGEPPYGKRLKAPGALKGTADYGVLVPDEYETEVVQMALELRGEGWSLEQIAKRLNEVGYKTRNSTPWKKQYIHAIVSRNTFPQA